MNAFIKFLYPDATDDAAFSTLIWAAPMNIRKLKRGALVELECLHFVAEGLGLSYFADDSEKLRFKPVVFFIWGVGSFWFWDFWILETAANVSVL